MSTSVDALDLVEHRLTAHGCHPKRRGDALTARCPAHEDSNPSLSVSTGTKRDLVIHCHAGCAPSDVMGALDLRWSDLPSANSTHATTTEQVATYDYTDAEGALVYQVVRYEPKTFRQRRPDGRGGWVWNVKGVTPLLYRLPEVLAAVAAGEPVWIAEGEKDADALARCGVAATCNHGGAGKFTISHAEVLSGAECIVVADKDTAGRTHAETVAGALGLAGASWRVVEATEGKDATDHLRAGYGLDEFGAVDLGTSDPVAPEDHPLTAFLVDWDELWAADVAAEWILEPLFAAGRAHAIYAGAKTGKSYLALAACAALATGRAFLQHPGGEPIDVLYVDYEMTPEDLRDRLEEFGYGPGDDLSHLHYASLPLLPPLDTAEGGEALLASARAVGAVLVVIDTLSRAIEGEENDADTLRNFYRVTGLPLKAAGIAWSRLDHAGKDATRGQRGSSAKNDDVDVVLRLERVDGGVKLIATHRRMSWYPETTAVLIGENDAGVVEFSTEEVVWPAGTKDLVARLDDLGVPPDAGRPTARKALVEAGVKVQNKLVEAAVRWRRDHWMWEDAFTTLGEMPDHTERDTARGQVSGQNGTEAARGIRGQSSDPSVGAAGSCAGSAGSGGPASRAAPVSLDTGSPCAEDPEEYLL